jgi:hypothetical protein
MKLPDNYVKARQTLPLSEISFGVGGIKLLTAEEMEEGQVGYRVTPNGKSLCSEEEGAWQPSWVVIGYETSCGDPLFIDTAEAKLPVLSAMQGEGTWEAMPVASSFTAFVESFREFEGIARGRRNPVELDANPLSEAERSAFLSRVDELNQGEAESSFWAVVTEC